MEKKRLSRKFFEEAGKRGGEQTKKRKGKNFFKEIASKPRKKVEKQAPWDLMGK